MTNGGEWVGTGTTLDKDAARWEERSNEYRAVPGHPMSSRKGFAEAITGDEFLLRERKGKAHSRYRKQTDRKLESGSGSCGGGRESSGGYEE